MIKSNLSKTVGGNYLATKRIKKKKKIEIVMQKKKML